MKTTIITEVPIPLVIIEAEVGPQGPPGNAGVSEIPGPPGADGPPGDKGDKGDTGANGPQGPPGADGSPGGKGDKGDDGADGPQGIPGDKGADGADGPPGSPGDKGDTGAQGPQGIPGGKGDKGDTGAASTVPGPQGPQGDRGAQGPQGIPGTTPINSRSFTINNPANPEGTHEPWDEYILFWRTPDTLELTAIHILPLEGNSLTGGLCRFDPRGLRPEELMREETFPSDQETTIASFEEEMPAEYYIGWHTTGADGRVKRLHITFEYKVASP